MKKFISSLLGIKPAPVQSADAARDPDWVHIDSDETTAVYYDRSRVLRKNKLVGFYLLVNFLEPDESEQFQSVVFQSGIDGRDGVIFHWQLDYYSQPYAKGEIVRQNIYDDNNQSIHSAFASNRGKMIFNILCG